MPHHVTLACDLGGTRVKLGAFSDGNLLRDLVLPSRAGESGRILELGRRLRELAAELSLGRVDGLGIGIPAIVDSSAKRVLDRHGKFDDLLDFDFDAWSRREFGCPVAIDNDARVAMLGEWRRGAGRGARSLVYIGLGTGIGTGVVMDGRPLRGEHYQAGIMGGHLCLKPGGRACGCGSAGCYEAETSLPAAMELARGSSHFGSSPLARAANPDFALLFEADAAGDPCAREVVETCVRNWSALVVSLIHAYDPDRVVIGGGIMRSAKRILPPLRDYVARYAHVPWGRIEILPAELGDRAALVGCDLIAREGLSGGEG